MLEWKLPDNSFGSIGRGGVCLIGMLLTFFFIVLPRFEESCEIEKKYGVVCIGEAYFPLRALLWYMSVGIERKTMGANILSHSPESNKLTHCTKVKNAKVLEVTQKEKRKPRPSALNTCELMRLCSSGLGIGPQHTMTVAERLYMQV